MGQYAIKVFITAVVVVAVAELGKRSSFWAAALASLPLTSLLAFIWLHVDGGSAEDIAQLAMGIFWLVLPSLALFLLLPLLLRGGMNFWVSLLLSCIATAAAYWAMTSLLARMGVRL